jgi:hypothetical protein
MPALPAPGRPPPRGPPAPDTGLCRELFNLCATSFAIAAAALAGSVRLAEQFGHFASLVVGAEETGTVDSCVGTTTYASRG